MRYLTHTIYAAHFDPAPGRGHKPVQVGINFAQTPCLVVAEVRQIAAELLQLADDMERAEREAQ
jgi:hypothetical protein